MYRNPIYMRPHPFLSTFPFCKNYGYLFWIELKLNKGKIKQTNKQKMYICELALPSSSFPISPPRTQPSTIGTNHHHTYTIGKILFRVKVIKGSHCFIDKHFSIISIHSLYMFGRWLWKFAYKRKAIISFQSFFFVTFFL